MRWWLAAPLVLVMACVSPVDPDTAAAPEYFRLADQDDIPTLDPALGYDTASWQFEELLFSTLVDYDESGTLVPELASDWEVTPDGRTYTFRLRRDARFSNGRPVVAADLRYSIERVVDPSTRSPGSEFFRGIQGAADCTAAACNLPGIETPDAHTVHFRLEHVDPLFLHKLAMPFAAVVPAEEVALRGDDFGRQPIGSGPFVLEEWRSGQRVVFRRNPHYFIPGEPRVAGVVRLVGVNDQLQWLKYVSGQLDAVAIPPAEFVRVMRDSAYSGLVHRETTMRTNYLGINCAMAPFSDRRVRQALNHAIDKRKLLRLLNDRGVAAKSFLPPNMPGHDPGIEGYSFDPSLARGLLQQAGLADGISSTLWVRLDDTTLRLAQSVQQDLAAVGVSVQIKALAWGPFLEAVRTSDRVALFLLGWEADFPDPSNFLEVLLHSKQIGSNNNTNYSSPEVDAVLDAAARTIDAEERLTLLREAERLALADAPWVPLYHPVTYRIVHPRVRDFRLHPLRPERLESVWLEDAP